MLFIPDTPHIQFYVTMFTIRESPYLLGKTSVKGVVKLGSCFTRQM